MFVKEMRERERIRKKTKEGMGFHSGIRVWFYTIPSNTSPSGAVNANEEPEGDPQLTGPQKITKRVYRSGLRLGQCSSAYR